MEVYESFAKMYDRLMREIPYEKWCRNLKKLLRQYGVPEGSLLLELGCGTGTMTELLAREGYDMTGVDASPEMLQEAMEKRDKSGLPILYLLQDMREFELYGTMAAVVSVCDTMNYLTDPADLSATLRLVNNYLDPGGVFIFDLKTRHFFEDELGSRTEADTEQEEAVCIWENDFDPEEALNTYALTMFTENKDGLYERTEELHVHRAYSLQEIRALSEEAGMQFLAAYGEDGDRAADEKKDSRIYVVLREQGKEKEGK